VLQSQHRDHEVRLREIFADAQFLGAEDIRVQSCSGDSRTCSPGDLFVALAGPRHDGHDFIEQAVARGASAILSERPLQIRNVPTCVVPSTRRAYGELHQALAGHPSRELKVVGVTGTNGKTTTTCLIASVLAEAGYRIGTLGTLGYSDSSTVEPSELTTPEAPELAHWLSRMRSQGCSHAVMEVSSQSLTESRVAGVQFDAACVTNVLHDHLDYHGSLVNYRNAKSKLFEHLTQDAFAVLNADDSVSAGYLHLLHRPVLTVGIEQEAELTATLVERSRSEQTFLLHAGSDTAAVRTQMIGDHHIYNCLQAAAVGLAYGIHLKTIVRGLEAVGYVPGRLERLECGQPFGVFVDYAHTPHALAAVLDTLREVTTGRLICVFGTGGQRDSEKRPEMGRIAEARADRVIITSDNPRHEDPAKITREILMGCKDPSRAEVELDRSRAIHRALTGTEAGDTVLIAGKGHEDHQLIGSQRLPFDDRDVALRWLYNLAPAPTFEASGGYWTSLSNS